MLASTAPTKEGRLGTIIHVHGLPFEQLKPGSDCGLVGAGVALAARGWHGSVTGRQPSLAERGPPKLARPAQERGSSVSQVGLRARCPSEAGGPRVAAASAAGDFHVAGATARAVVSVSSSQGPSVWFTASTDLPLHSGLTAAPAAWGLEPGEVMQLPVGWEQKPPLGTALRVP